MFRPTSNPVSQFARSWTEWEIPPPAADVVVTEDHSRSILSHNDSPDLGFRWSVNPYRGCQHGCAYCYARPSHEHLGYGAGTDFETKLVVKPRAADLLAAAFAAASWKGEWILFSGNVDCYQPLEVRWGLTRACLEVCLRYRNPCGVITRSAVIERDLDLLEALHRATGQLGVRISVPFHDAVEARAMEPMAPQPSRRFQTIARLAERGIPVGVNVAPVIPGLTDRQIPAILADARAAGARFATMIALRLPGPVGPVFEQRLRAAFPLRADTVMGRIRRMRGGRLNDPTFGDRMRGEGEAWAATRRLFEVTRARLGFEEAPAAGALPTTFCRPGQLSLFG